VDFIADRVEKAIQPVLEGEGFETVLVEYVARSRILRLYVDHADGITVDDCGRVSRLVGDLLDAEGLSDEIEGRYTLEVSSPGLDRPLVRPAHFKRFVGRKIRVTTQVAQEGRRKLTGELATADDEGIRLVSEGRSYAIAYGTIARARLVPEL
jgi:ribosome maturation factor RimP